MLLLSTSVVAQNSNSDYTIENTWGITKNTMSGLIAGIVLKRSVKNTSGSFTTYGVELINYKHPAQLRWIAGTGNSFALGKINHFFSIRGQYGRDYILFKKSPQQGVQISLNLAIGPSIGLEAPYYIEYGQLRVPYNPSQHSSGNITGKGFIFQGLFQSNIVIGVNVKTSLSFEFGSQKSSISGFEAGFLLDGYARKIQMMDTPDNYAVWPMAFIAIFYGSRK